ncbi:MAG: OmpA family protein, partial [Alphaproteobacteria bacterium]
ASKTLARAAEIALAMPEGMRLRIVGYADSDGTTEANRITSKRRSDWALEQLARLGVPQARMVSVGRGAENLLSPDATDDSPNRRVEFEAFE